nr:immunoglobulin light chain junction region [Macaca mulatta]MOV94524.1 immunoglobulin light chain junction region [Macaca mulatta]MOV94608.1 immunoglobulin light chain junction region [Macaca mulatta]MOV94820.1 immunoglobulin light chain junction region [Macaca mulatta]MOV94830.1 immunoglobulin light chain junction region [Macaca mulatta]
DYFCCSYGSAGTFIF